jgi:hypothetical protein
MKAFLAVGLLGISSASLAECELPLAIAGKTFTNTVEAAYSPQNPNAGSIVRLELAASTYKLHLLKVGKVVEGNYAYQRLANNVGQLIMREAFEGQTTHYTLTLVCVSPLSGTFVYTQERGAIKPDVRQNTGTYTLQEYR